MAEPITEPMDQTPDETLDDVRLRLAPRIAQAAVFDGWSAQALRVAADQAGIDADVAAYAFRGGAMEMIEAWTAATDLAMAQALPATTLASFKVRVRIRKLVLFRLEAIRGCEEALSRALAIMAMPQNAGRALKLGWRSADAMWRLAGDTATDYNHYTKRTILAGVYAATLAVFADDGSPDKDESRAFLDRRLDGIMRFERVKAQLVRSPEERFSMARFLGRLRYPAR
jgi:ubiquinone biosynthesis protein COQ9